MTPEQSAKLARAALMTARSVAKPAAGVPATMSAYQPTVRDRAEAWIADHIPFGDNYLRQNIAHTVTDSPLSPLNWTPVGAAFAADDAGRQAASGHPIAGTVNAALAAIPVPGVVKAAKAVARPAERAAAETVEKVAPQIVAYHGSPHTFDAFDTARIGTGEGAQAYGHGLYFAENEGVAKQYRDRLARAVSDTPTAQGAAMRALALGDTTDDAIASLNSQLRAVTRGGDKMRAQGRHDIAANYDAMAKTYTDALDMVRNATVNPNGSMYKVGINANPEHFIDWDAPLDAQHPTIQSVLGTGTETAGGKLSRAYRNPLFAGDITGTDKATPDELSAHLASQGIPGIKYFDQGSRGAGDGTRNYVVFDPSNVDVLDRYKRGGPVVRKALALTRNLGPNHNPTEAQKAAGNYRKEHISFQGLPITIENKKGSIRRGVDSSGKPWACQLPADYGYIKGTEGADRDHVDVYVGPDPHSRIAFIVNQIDVKTGRFDEHKIVVGVNSERQALDIYERAFSDGRGRARCASIETVSVDALKHWLRTGKTKTRASAPSIIDRALGVARKAAA